MMLICFRVYLCAYLYLYTDTAAYALQSALLVEETDIVPLVRAAYWLETAVYMESTMKSFNTSRAHTPYSLFKNAGLAHVHLVRNNLLKGITTLPPLVSSAVASTMSSKERAKVIEDVFNSSAFISWPSGQIR